MTKHDEFTLKLAVFYKEPLTEVITTDDIGHTERIPNYRIQENHLWVLEHISEKQLDSFFRKITTVFKQTSTVPYPTPGDLQQIYNMDINNNPVPDVDETREYLKNLRKAYEKSKEEHREINYDH